MALVVGVLLEVVLGLEEGGRQLPQFSYPSPHNSDMMQVSLAFYQQGIFLVLYKVVLSDWHAMFLENCQRMLQLHGSPSAELRNICNKHQT